MEEGKKEETVTEDNQEVTNNLAEEENTAEKTVDIPNSESATIQEDMTFISQNPMPEARTSTMEDEFGIYNKKSKKWLIILIVLIIIAVIGVGGYFVYRYIYMANPLNIYTKAIDMAYNEYNDMLEEAKKEPHLEYAEGDSITVSGELKINGNVDELLENDEQKELADRLFNMRATYNLGIDTKKQNLELGLGIQEGGKKLIGGNVYYIDGAVYGTLPEAANDVYTLMTKEDVTKAINEMGIELKEDENGNIDIKELVKSLVKSMITAGESDEGNYSQEVQETLDKAMQFIDDYQMPNVDYDELSELGKIVRDVLKDSIKEDNLTKEDDNITINDKSVEVTANIYTMDKRDIQDLVEKLLKELRDGKGADILAHITGVSKDNIKEGLDKLIEKLGFSEWKELEIVIYTKGVKIVGFAIRYDGEDISNYVEDGDYFELVIGDKNDYFKVVKDKEITINIYFDKTKFASVTVDSEDSSYVIKISDSEIDCTIISSTKVENEKKSVNTIDVSYKYKTEDGPTITFGFNMDVTVELGKKVAQIDVSNAKNINELSEEELANLEDYVEKAFSESIFGELLLQPQAIACSRFSIEDCVCYDGECYCMEDDGNEVTCPASSINGITL